MVILRLSFNKVTTKRFDLGTIVMSTSWLEVPIPYPRRIRLIKDVTAHDLLLS